MLPLTHGLIVAYVGLEAVSLVLTLLFAPTLTYPWHTDRYESASALAIRAVLRFVVRWLGLPLMYVRVALGYHILRWAGWL